MIKFAFRAALVALGLTATVPALAADADRFAATLTATGVSDYRFRGISQTDTAPALQLGADGAFKFNDFLAGYIGVWGSNVDFNNDAKAEVDALIGFRWTFDKLSLDTGVIRYNYVGANEALNLDFTEYKLTAAYDFGFAIPSAGVYYSPEFQGDSSTGVYYTAGITVPLPITQFEPKLIANIGKQTIDRQQNYFGAGSTTDDYMDWNVGLFATFWGFTAGIQYVDTNLSKQECFGGLNWCEAGAVFSVGYSYAF